MSISMALTSQAVRLRARLQPWTPVEQLHGRRYPEPARIPADLRRSPWLLHSVTAYYLVQWSEISPGRRSTR